MAGGAHVDALPEEAISEGVDIVVHGEGEDTILEILEAWEDKRSLSDIAGISFKDENGDFTRTRQREPTCDLNKLPMPDFDVMVEMKRPLVFVPFERTRGCNYKCEFCIVNDRFGPSRSASPEKVAQELEYRVDSGYRHFFCIDDNFTQGREDTIRLLDLIQDIKRRKRVNLDLTVQVRSSVGRDEELMKKMRAADVRLLCIGLESPIREELESMSKRQTPEQIEKDVRNLRRHGFMIHGMFIFGYPLEDASAMTKLTLRERADRYIAFIKRTALDTIQVMKPVPIPGSRLAERLRKQGRILPLSKAGWDRYDGNFLTFMPDIGVSASELHKQATRIMRRFYSPVSFLRFPVLVFTTPVDILREGFSRAHKYARDRAQSTQEAISGGVEKVSALKAGFQDACNEVSRRWRNANLRTMGSMVFTSWVKTGHHAAYMKMLSSLQTKLGKERG